MAWVRSSGRDLGYVVSPTPNLIWVHIEKAPEAVFVGQHIANFRTIIIVSVYNPIAKQISLISILRELTSMM